MKTIHSINKWSLIITLVLYITVIGGLLAQILLGFIQVIMAMVIISDWKKLNILSKKLIITYWILVVVYWISYYIVDLYGINSNGIILYVIAPMSIASYFVYITSKITELKNNTIDKQIHIN